MSLRLLLFLLNLCYCLPSTLVLIQPMPWYDKIPSPRYGYATSMITPGIDYGLYLDNYDTSVIDYNTVTM